MSYLIHFFDIYNFYNGQDKIKILDNNLTADHKHFKNILKQLIKENENENELVSDEENDPEAIKRHRQQVDKDQEEQLKEQMRTPPSDIVSGSESESE